MAALLGGLLSAALPALQAALPGLASGGLNIAGSLAKSIAPSYKEDFCGCDDKEKKAPTQKQQQDYAEQQMENPIRVEEGKIIYQPRRKNMMKYQRSARQRLRGY